MLFRKAMRLSLQFREKVFLCTLNPQGQVTLYCSENDFKGFAISCICNKNTKFLKNTNFQSLLLDDCNLLKSQNILNEEGKENDNFEIEQENKNKNEAENKINKQNLNKRKVESKTNIEDDKERTVSDVVLSEKEVNEKESLENIDDEVEVKILCATVNHMIPNSTVENHVMKSIYTKFSSNDTKEINRVNNIESIKNKSNNNQHLANKTSNVISNNERKYRSPVSLNKNIRKKSSSSSEPTKRISSNKLNKNNIVFRDTKKKDSNNIGERIYAGILDQLLPSKKPPKKSVKIPQISDFEKFQKVINPQKAKKEINEINNINEIKVANEKKKENKVDTIKLKSKSKEKLIKNKSNAIKNVSAITEKQIQQKKLKSKNVKKNNIEINEEKELKKYKSIQEIVDIMDDPSFENINVERNKQEYIEINNNNNNNNNNIYSNKTETTKIKKPREKKNYSKNEELQSDDLENEKQNINNKKKTVAAYPSTSTIPSDPKEKKVKNTKEMAKILKEKEKQKTKEKKNDNEKEKDKYKEKVNEQMNWPLHKPTMSNTPERQPFFIDNQFLNNKRTRGDSVDTSQLEKNIFALNNMLNTPFYPPIANYYPFMNYYNPMMPIPQAQEELKNSVKIDNLQNFLNSLNSPIDPKNTIKPQMPNPVETNTNTNPYFINFQTLRTPGNALPFINHLPIISPLRPDLYSPYSNMSFPIPRPPPSSGDSNK